MIRSTYGYMLTDQYAYMVLLPATKLFLVVLSAVFLSNGLKDAFELRFDCADKKRI